MRVVVAVAAGLAAAVAGASAQRSSAACAATVEFRGGAFEGIAVSVKAKAAGLIGIGVVPGCSDVPGHRGTSSHQVAVFRIRGVPSAQAFFAGNLRRVIYVRRDLVTPKRLPAPVEYIIRGPRCRAADAPVSLSGPGLAIAGTETTEARPGVVQLTVRGASAQRYLHARLTVHVPSRLHGQLLGVSAIRPQLLSVTARCYRGTFIATSLRTD